MFNFTNNNNIQWKNIIIVSSFICLHSPELVSYSSSLVSTRLSLDLDLSLLVCTHLSFVFARLHSSLIRLTLSCHSSVILAKTMGKVFCFSSFNSSMYHLWKINRDLFITQPSPNDWCNDIDSHELQLGGIQWIQHSRVKHIDSLKFSWRKYFIFLYSLFSLEQYISYNCGSSTTTSHKWFFCHRFLFYQNQEFFFCRLAWYFFVKRVFLGIFL